MLLSSTSSSRPIYSSPMQFLQNSLSDQYNKLVKIEKGEIYFKQNDGSYIGFNIIRIPGVFQSIPENNDDSELLSTTTTSQPTFSSLLRDNNNNHNNNSNDKRKQLEHDDEYSVIRQKLKLLEKMTTHNIPHMVETLNTATHRSKSSSTTTTSSSSSPSSTSSSSSSSSS